MHVPHMQHVLNENRSNTNWANHMRKSGLHFVDVTPAMMRAVSLTQDVSDFYYPLDQHNTQRGTNISAEQTLKALLERGIIQKARVSARSPE